MGLTAPAQAQQKQRLGDRFFRGVNMRLAPEVLEPGFAASAKNCRFNRGVPETRLGTMVFPWTNNISATGIAPWGTVYGTGWFNDPDSFQDYLIIAADGNVYVCFQDNYPEQMTLPSGVTITEAVTFTQAFDTLIMHRGFDAPALKCDGPSDAWEFIGQSDRYIPGSQIGHIASYAEIVITEAQGIVRSPYPPTMTVDGVVVNAAFTYTGEPRTVSHIEGGVPAGHEVVFNGTVTARFTPSPAWQPGERHVVRLQYLYVRANAWNKLDNGTYSLVGASIGGAASPNQVFDTTYTSGPSQFIAGTAEIPRVKRSIFHQNRLFLAGENDEVFISDANDYTRYQPVLQAFRINQGSSDRLVRIVKFNDTTIIAFKEHSIYAINNVYGTFADASLDLITDQFGLAAADSVAHCGRDLLFLSGHGVMSLQQTEQNKLQCVVLPLSDPIQPLIDRINWKFAPDAYGAYWENRYYLAVPLDEAEQLGPELTNAQSTYLDASDVLVVPVESGKTYRWEKHSNDLQLVNGTETLTFSGDFTAQGSSVSITGIIGDSVIQCSLKKVYKGVSNAILVYDFLNQAWAGYDQEDGLVVKKMFLFPVDNRQRLFITTHEGYVKIYEEDYEDQLSVPTSTITISSAPANGTTVRINNGETITADTSLSLNSGTSWACLNASVAKSSFLNAVNPDVRSYSPLSASQWTSPNAYGVATGGLTDGIARFYGLNGIIPNIVTKVFTLSSLTRTNNTATATTGSAHGYSANDTVTIDGANQSAYNGKHIIETVPTATTFTFTVYGEPATPATGTVKSGVALTSTTATWATVVEQQHQPIEFELVTRAYTDPSGDLSQYPWLAVDMQTWNPTYSVSVVQPGAEEEFEAIADRTRDRTKWYRPFDKSDFDLTNSDGRFMDKWRQDYSIEFGAGTGQTAGIDTHTTTDGIRCDLHQDHRELVHLMRSGRSLQAKITNTTGRMRVMAVLLDAHKRASEGYGDS